MTKSLNDQPYRAISNGGALYWLTRGSSNWLMIGCKSDTKLETNCDMLTTHWLLLLKVNWIGVNLVMEAAWTNVTCCLSCSITTLVAPSSTWCTLCALIDTVIWDIDTDGFQDAELQFLWAFMIRVAYASLLFAATRSNERSRQYFASSCQHQEHLANRFVIIFFWMQRQRAYGTSDTFNLEYCASLRSIHLHLSSNWGSGITSKTRPRMVIGKSWASRAVHYGNFAHSIHPS